MFLKAAQATSAENDDEDDGYSDVGDGDDDDGGDYNNELEGTDRYTGHFQISCGRNKYPFH